MNCIETKKLALGDVLSTFSYDKQHAQTITEIAASCARDSATSDVVSALAWWIAQDLYSESSTDEMNLERIAFGLESASRQLSSLGMRLRDMGSELDS